MAADRNETVRGHGFNSAVAGARGDTEGRVSSAYQAAELANQNVLNGSDIQTEVTEAREGQYRGNKEEGR